MRFIPEKSCLRCQNLIFVEKYQKRNFLHFSNKNIFKIIEMAENKTFCPKIIKITALVLAFLLLVKTFLCFLLSFAILEEPPEDWPQRLKGENWF